MAKFKMELPNEVMKEIQKIYGSTEQIFGEMTQAGALVVLENVRANVPESFKDSEIMKCLRVTKVYKTPSDDGINTKVAFYGYFINSEGVRTPAPLVANVFEYGSTKFVKRPFMRKSFRKQEIERAMLEAQKKASGGLLE